MGLITPDDRTTIIRECGRSSQSFAKSIVRLGIIQEKDLPELLTKRAGAVKASPEDIRFPTREALGLIDRGLISKLEILPLKVDLGRLLIAMGDPLDRDTVSQVQFFVRKPVVALVANFTELHEAIARHVGDSFTPSIPPLAAFLDRHSVRIGAQKIAIEEMDEEELSYEEEAQTLDFEPPSAPSGEQKSNHKNPTLELTNNSFQPLDPEEDDPNIEYQDSGDADFMDPSAALLDSDNQPNGFDLELDDELSGDAPESPRSNLKTKGLDEDSVLDDSFEFDEEPESTPLSQKESPSNKKDSKSIASPKDTLKSSGHQNEVASSGLKKNSLNVSKSLNTDTDHIDLDGLGDDDDISFESDEDLFSEDTKEGSSGLSSKTMEESDALSSALETSETDNALESDSDLASLDDAQNQIGTDNLELKNLDLNDSNLNDLGLEDLGLEDLGLDETASAELDSNEIEIAIENTNAMNLTEDLNLDFSEESDAGGDVSRKSSTSPITHASSSLKQASKNDLGDALLIEADLFQDLESPGASTANTQTTELSSLSDPAIDFEEEDVFNENETFAAPSRDPSLLQSMEFSNELEDELGVSLLLDQKESRSEKSSHSEEVIREPKQQPETAMQKGSPTQSRSTSALDNMDTELDMLEADLSLIGQELGGLDDISLESETLEDLGEISLSGEIQAPTAKKPPTENTNTSHSHGGLIHVSSIVNHAITSIFTSDTEQEAAATIMEAMKACGASKGWWVRIASQPTGFYWNEQEQGSTSNTQLQIAQKFQDTNWAPWDGFELISIPLGSNRIVVAADWNPSTDLSTKNAVVNLFKRLVAAGHK
jgi:hypothetical protein